MAFIDERKPGIPGAGQPKLGIPGGMASTPAMFDMAGSRMGAPGGSMSGNGLTLLKSEQGEPAKAIDEAQLKKWTKALQEYKSAKALTESRIIQSENWWKLRNTREERRTTEIGKDGGFASVSGWLHNVISNKHADAIEAFPEPNILPREAGDRQEAVMLSKIIPCVLEQNGFEKTYNDIQWSKMKTGTGCYKVIWDKNALNGLGDIRVEPVNILNIYWEPEKSDIQKSRYIFHTELVEREQLLEQYPQLQGKLKNSTMVQARFLYDEKRGNSDYATVIEVYYKKRSGSKTVLHYCKYVGDQVLFATENETTQDYDPMTGAPIGEPMSSTGLYDHGLYPFVFDALFPIEGSPCGYGYVDLCKNPQTEIDLLKTAMIKNAQVGATPRYFSANNGTIDEEEFLDLSRPLVHVNGTVDDTSLRLIDHTRLDGMYVNVLNQDIQELRETSGNTETATGSTSAGVTAASAIAALQEASGKGSRDSTHGAYRAYSQVVNICIELVRQFYDMPRQFRIVGEMGQQQFVSYSNQGIQPQQQVGPFGEDMGIRKPVFDIKVSAQRKSVYTKVSNNEMALQFFQLGFFNPNLAEQALLTLDIMDFDGKEEIMQKISKNAMVMQKLVFWVQNGLMMAQALGNAPLAQQAMMDMQQLGMAAPAPRMAASEGKPSIAEGDEQGGLKQKEHGLVTKARERAQSASQPDGGGV